MSNRYFLALLAEEIITELKELRNVCDELLKKHRQFFANKVILDIRNETNEIILRLQSVIFHITRPAKAGEPGG